MRKAISLSLNFVNSVLDIIAPNLCLVCNGYINKTPGSSKYLCGNCLDSLPAAPTPDEVYNSLIGNFPGDELAISSAYSLFSVKDSQFMEIIHAFKYGGFTGIGLELGEMLGRYLSEIGAWYYDAIIPVPIHHAKERERGFNQSFLIAKGMSIAMNIPVNNNLVRRKTYTKTQTLLNPGERRINVFNAFIEAGKHFDLHGKSYLLVDDVLTTGSTLNAAANTLLNMGARSVDAASIAHA